MTNKILAQLLYYKKQILSLRNQATEDNITSALEVIESVSSYASTTFSDLSYKVFEELEIIHNYLLTVPKDNNNTMLIIVKENLLKSIDALINEIEANGLQCANRTDNNIFIVHGREDTLKLAVSDFLRIIGLKPIILHEEVNMGQVIFEKLEKTADKAHFAIVLLSPEDCVNDNGKMMYRARQNVIFELGYFCGKYGRQNTFALYDTSKGKEIELPSDIQGVLYEKYDEPYGNWRIALSKGLKAAGYSVDLNKLVY